MAPTRRLAAILAADVAGYSRLMGADEEGTHERLQAHLWELVHPKIEEHRGRVVKNTGDGFLVEFPSVVDAVRCASELQRGMAERNATVPPDKRIDFRMGINLGDVIVGGDDIFGDGVNVAARLEGLAEPGGICVSGTVRDHIGERLPHAFEDMGDQQVKNIVRPVRAYALRPEGLAAPSRRGSSRPSSRGRAIVGTAAAAMLVIASLTWWLWPASNFFSRSGKPANQGAATAAILSPLIAPRLSIVVLPFANLSRDPDQQYFADGITEDLTTDLSRIPHMLVISRDTAFTYKDKPVNAKEIGRDLGVRYVLEGSVQRSDDKVRVNAQLIDAETDTHLWAEQFDRKIGDLFILQNDITGRIANTLDVTLAGAEAARTTGNPDAQDYIFRGRSALYNAASPEGFSEAIKFFEQALALEPRSGEAQLQLAFALLVRVSNEATGSPARDIARSERLIGQGLAASPDSPLGHFDRGLMLRMQGRPDEAIFEFEAVLAYNANSSTATYMLGWCKMMTGSIDEAIPLTERAIRLTPRTPGIAWEYTRMGLLNLFQSRTDDALQWFEKARTANRRFAAPHAMLAAVYALKGETDRAAAELAQARRLSPDNRYSSLAGVKAAGLPGSPNYWGVPKVRALFEATYFAGLRKAGMPEE